MKNLYLTIALLGAFSVTANASDLIKNLYSGTEIQFAQGIQLKQGQKALQIGSRTCKFQFATAASGKQHIEEGQSLIVSHVEVNPTREIQNPSTGKFITANPSIKIKFKGKMSLLSCRGKNALLLEISNLESDNLIKIIPPSKSTRFTID